MTNASKDKIASTFIVSIVGKKLLPVPRIAAWQIITDRVAFNGLGGVGKT
jgi:hypothetical protein